MLDRQRLFLSLSFIIVFLPLPTTNKQSRCSRYKWKKFFLLRVPDEQKQTEKKSHWCFAESMSEFDRLFAIESQLSYPKRAKRFL